VTASVFLLIAPAFVVLVAAEPAQQNPTRTPTEEPTKGPYIFPTPIFIPTYTSATDLPLTRVPSTPRPTGSATGEQTYTVESGDNPSLIAKKVYGDPGKYRLIVEANNLTDSTRLRVGTVLIIPPLTPPAATPAAAAPTVATAQTAPAANTPPTTSAIASATASPTLPEFSTRPANLTPTPQSNSGAGASGFGGFAEIALRGLSIFFLLGSLATGGLALLFYREARRRENVSLIKRRLKGE
jgi:LysM domain-containing protein